MVIRSTHDAVGPSFDENAVPMLDNGHCNPQSVPVTANRAFHTNFNFQSVFALTDALSIYKMPYAVTCHFLIDTHEADRYIKCLRMAFGIYGRAVVSRAAHS